MAETVDLTQEEIMERAAEIRKGWNADTERKRAGRPKGGHPVEMQEVTVDSLHHIFMSTEF